MSENGPKPYRYCPYCRAEMVDRLAFGRVRRVCPDCGFVHFVDPKVGAAVLVEQDDRVLMVRRAVDPGNGAWCLPSGFMEHDESPAQAAIRECLEETGLEVEITELMGVEQYSGDFRGQGIVVFYKAAVVGGTLQAGDDAREARFFAPDELPVDIAFESNRLALFCWRRDIPLTKQVHTKRL